MGRLRAIRPLETCLRWLLTLLALAFLVLIPASLRWLLLWAGANGLGTGVNPGIAFVGREAPGHPELIVERSDTPPGELRWWFQIEGDGRTWFVGVPLWCLALVAAAPAAWLWRRRLKPLRGHCLQYGYDLSGGTSVCPECGTATAAVVAKR